MIRGREIRGPNINNRVSHGLRETGGGNLNAIIFLLLLTSTKDTECVCPFLFQRGCVHE